MPQVEVIFYKEDEAVLIREWLKSVSNKAQRKCLLYIAQLEARGHELRRPIADYLRDGIYELRPSVQGSITECFTFSPGGRSLFSLMESRKREPYLTSRSNARLPERRDLRHALKRIRTDQDHQDHKE